MTTLTTLPLPPRSAIRSKSTPGRLTGRAAYLYLVPFLALFLVFGLYPIVYAGLLSVQDYLPGAPVTWTWFENYQRAFADPTFWIAIRNVAMLMGVVIPCQLLFGFVIASVMNGRLRNRTGLLSGVYYLPVVANLIVVSLIFQLLFQANGMVNYALSLAHLGPVPWLSSPTWAPVTTMVLIFWKGVGWYIVFLLAGMRGIDIQYYEAAKMDGANAFQRAVHITVPQLRPVITFLVVLGVISGWQIFAEPLLLFGGTGGGPGNVVLTPALYIYQQGFSNIDFSYAAALSVILGVVTMVASGTALLIGRRTS
jgi:ABC-type sugar transport system permease subunit